MHEIYFKTIKDTVLVMSDLLSKHFNVISGADPEGGSGGRDHLF